MHAASDRRSNIRRRLRRRSARVALAVLAVVVVAGGLFAAKTIRDRGESKVEVTIVNGLGQTVDFRRCRSSSCQSTVDSNTLRDGAELLQDVAPNSPVSYQVVSAGGETLGCWVLSVTTLASHQTFSVIQPDPCPPA